jgi:hypothetical protein
MVKEVWDPITAVENTGEEEGDKSLVTVCIFTPYYRKSYTYLIYSDIIFL